MKKRQVTLMLSDEDAATLDAIRYAYGDAGAQALGDVVRRFLHGCAQDPEVRALRRLQQRRGLRVVS
jgi:hypothetical protein